MTAPLVGSHATNIGWADARNAAFALGAAVPTRPADVVPLAEAAGRVLAHDVFALSAMPRLDASAMDGWAVAEPGADGGWTVGESVLAGDAPAITTLAQGEARPIATGAPVPPGTVAVLRSEHGDVVGGTLRLGPLATRSPRAGDHVRPAGEEALRGDPLLRAGLPLTPPRIALCAAAGYDHLAVAAAVAGELLVLGDELVDEGEPRPGAVRDALGPSLPGVLRSVGLGIVRQARCPDDARATLAALAATEAPLVVTTGGSARGPADFVRGAISGLGGRLVVDGVAMRPGHPVMVASLPGGRVLLALPGNPLAAMLCLVGLGAPIVDGMLGRRSARLGRAELAAEAFAPAASVRLMPCEETDNGLVPLPWQGSGMLRGLAAADAVAVIPAGGAPAGTSVPVLPLPW